MEPQWYWSRKLFKIATGIPILTLSYSDVVHVLFKSHFATFNLLKFEKGMIFV